MKNDNSKLIASAAIASVLALGGVGVVSDAEAGDYAGKEKCKGIAKAGENGCAANGHPCAGQAKVDYDPNEWILVKAGTCAEKQAEVAKLKAEMAIDDAKPE